MSEYSLASPPSALSEDAQSRWVEEAPVDPSPGDVWLLSWDGDARGLVLVTSVHLGFVRGMPITLGTRFASENEAVLPETALGAEATIWYRAETGLGAFLLHRCLGSVASTEQIRELRRASFEGTDPPLPRGSGPRDAEAEAYFARLLDEYQSLCFIEWPAPVPGEAVLDTKLLISQGVDIEALAGACSLSVPEALHLWKGEWTVSEVLAPQIASAFHFEMSDFLAVKLDDAIQELTSPFLKSGLATLAARRSISEREARNLVRSEFALAARSESVSKRNRTIARDTLSRLLAESDDAR